MCMAAMPHLSLFGGNAAKQVFGGTAANQVSGGTAAKHMLAALPLRLARA